MKIAIVAPTPIPFLVGGAEKFFWGLQKAFNQYTSHDVELIKVPCDGNSFWSLMAGCRRFYELDLTYFDAVISTKDPAWLLPHPNHHIYLQHRCRIVYDLYPDESALALPALPGPEFKTLYSVLAGTGSVSIGEFLDILFALKGHPQALAAFRFPGPLTRAVIHWLDRQSGAPGAIKSYSAISANVARRADYFPTDVPVTVQHHPTDVEGFNTKPGRFIFTASRLEDLKRIDLLIKAYRLVKGDTELRIAGTGGRGQYLKKLAQGDRRIKFLGFISDAEMLELYAESLFVPFVPFDEDYGLITLEAMLSGKPVLTVTDAGGVTELVQDGYNGLITEPEVEALAAGFERLLTDTDATRKMGEQARASVAHIDWPTTVDRLLTAMNTPASAVLSAAAAPSPSTITPVADDSCVATVVAGPIAVKPRLLVANTFSVWPPQSGGQKRIYHLYRELAAEYRIDLVSLAAIGTRAVSRELAPGFAEHLVPATLQFGFLVKKLQQQLKASVGDIAAIAGYRKIPALTHKLAELALTADLLVATHPYLFYALQEVAAGKPLWYDSHNFEYAMKGQVLPPTPEREYWLDQVRKLECACFCEATLISTVTAADADAMLKFYGETAARRILAPNGMDFSLSPAEPRPETERRALKQRLFGAAAAQNPVYLFVGSLHAPNVEALSLISACAQALPDALFLLVGSIDAAPECHALPSNVKSLGVLDEAEKNLLLEAADFALNPMLSGSGSNLKLLEYVAFTLPVITTPCGLRGFSLEADVHLEVADASDFVATAVRMAAADYISYKDRARSARAAARTRYDWSAIANTLKNSLSLNR